MANDPTFKMSIKDANGNYYYAIQNPDRSYSVFTSPTIRYLNVLPEGWDDTEITWERDLSYMGLFRSMTSGSYKFSGDGRAVIQYIRSQRGLLGYGMLVIYIKNESTSAGIIYPIFYPSELDFKSYHDYQELEYLEIGTLDAGIIRDLHGYGDTVFNTPLFLTISSVISISISSPAIVMWPAHGLINGQQIQVKTTGILPVGMRFNSYYWITVIDADHIYLSYSAIDQATSTYINTTGSQSGIQTGFYWQQDPDIKWIIHDGIKLLYNATYESSATIANPLAVGGLGGYCWGQTGSGVHEGFHMLPSLVPFNITQNNGTTTFLGNDILEPFLKQNSQTIGANALGGINEVQFDGVNNSQPWSRENNCLKNLLPNATSTIDMFVNVSGAFLASSAIATVGADFRSSAPYSFLAFVMWELGPGTAVNIPAGQTFIGNDSPLEQTVPAGSGMVYTPIYTIDIPNPVTPAPGDFSVTIPVTLKLNCCYVFGIIVDNPLTGGGSLDSSNAVTFTLTDLQYSVLSKYDMGASGVPIPAPSLPPSLFPGFRIADLWKKVVPYLGTTNSDSNGFPVPVANPYTGVSNFLNNSSLPPIGDCVPYQMMATSAYCIHDLLGPSYISVSANQIFDMCKKILGCAMGAVYDSDGNTIGLQLEDMGFFFPDCTNPANMILDLGTNVSGFEILQGGADLGIGSELKLGYTAVDTNSDFGVIPINTELFFNTPVSNVPGIMDYEEDNFLTDENAIEKIRAQKVSQPVGASINPAQPSDDNQAVLLYCLPSTTQTLPATGGNTNYPTLIAYDPVGNALSVSAFQLTQRNGGNLPAAQSTDATATTAPYIAGPYYPDTSINVELSPCRALQRATGGLLHSVLDKMDAESLVFRNTYVMQYNNTTLGLSGISSNLNVGSGDGPIMEMSDKLIGNLPAKYFLPVPIRIRSEYPINLYQIMQGRPGYVRFVWTGRGYNTPKEYKFYITKATQQANGEATVFEGWPTPDQVI